MKPINEAAVTFLSRSANEGFARTAAGGVAAPQGPPPGPGGGRGARPASRPNWTPPWTR